MRKIWKRNNLWVVLSVIILIITSLIQFVWGDIWSVKFAAWTTVFFLAITLIPGRIGHWASNRTIKKFFNQLSAKRRDFGITSAIAMFLHIAIAMNFYGGRDISFYMEEEIIPGVIAEIVLLIMFATSFFYLMQKFGKPWKALHRSIWIILPLIFLHASAANERYNSLNETFYFPNLIILIIFLVVLVDLIFGIVTKKNVKYKLQTLLLVILGSMIAFGLKLLLGI